jgi:Phage T4 tail fibre
MKKITLSLCLLFIVYGLSAQWTTIPSTNNIYNTGLGNVGVGTTTPAYKFEVNTSAGSEQSSLGIEKVNPGTDNPGLMPTTRLVYNWYATPKASINFHRGGGDQDGFMSFSTSATGTLVERMRIFRDGNVGIGTTDPGPFKLAVEGKIGAREVKVTLSAWADYVFNKEYKLMNLSELEAFIKKNNHLPNIPSAQEVKENGGIELGEMNAKLLEKVEELTLYVIELKKENEEIKKTLKNLLYKVK